jgi:hypothetical protein
MSFLWGKKGKAPPPGGLPPAAREISSSHGPDTRIPSANGMVGPREGVERRGTVGTAQAPSGPPPAAIIQKVNGEPPQRPVTRERSDSDFGVSVLFFAVDKLESNLEVNRPLEPAH